MTAALALKALYGEEPSFMENRILEKIFVKLPRGARLLILDGRNGKILKDSHVGRFGYVKLLRGERLRLPKWDRIVIGETLEEDVYVSDRSYILVRHEAAADA